MGSKDRGLSFELEDGAMNERLFQEVGRVIGREAGGEVIGAVEDGIVGLKKIEAIFCFESTFVLEDFDVWIDLVNSCGGAFEFGFTHAAGIVKDLSMQVGFIDDIGINQSNLSDSGGRQIENSGRTQPAGADAENGGILQFFLTRFPELRQHRLAKVSVLFPGRERHAGNL